MWLLKEGGGGVFSREKYWNEIAIYIYIYIYIILPEL